MAKPNPQPQPRLTHRRNETSHEQRIRAARLAMFRAMAKDALDG